MKCICLFLYAFQFCIKMQPKNYARILGFLHFVSVLIVIFVILAKTKTFGKIDSVNKAFLFWYWLRPKKCFLGIKLFWIGSWNIQHLFKNEFCEISQNFNSIRQPTEMNRNNNYLKELNELKFCEVSWTFISSRC